MKVQLRRERLCASLRFVGVESLAQVCASSCLPTSRGNGVCNSACNNAGPLS